MKILYFIILLTVACQPIQNKSLPADSLNGASRPEQAKNHVDSLKQTLNENIVEDAVSKNNISPVTLSGEVRTDEYNGKTLRIRLKNTSPKAIDAVRFGYTLLNNFGENVSGDRGFLVASYQETVKGNSSRLIGLDITSSATKVKSIFVTEIHFSDGSRWEAGK